MNQLLTIFAAVCLFVSCTSSSKYDASQLSDREQKEILYSVIRYMGHLPKKGTHENKFETTFDEYYSKLALDYEVEAYHKEAEYEYVLTSRIAPSVKVKKVAIGVKMKRDENGNLSHYEEVFRTWKFEIPEMKEKGNMLFEKMVAGEDLSHYYPQNSGKEEYIEFPDEKVSFDTLERRWKMEGNNTMNFTSSK